MNPTDSVLVESSSLSQQLLEAHIDDGSSDSPGHSWSWHNFSPLQLVSPTDKGAEKKIIVLPDGLQVTRWVPKSKGRCTLLKGFQKAGCAGTLPKVDSDAIVEALGNANTLATETRHKKDDVNTRPSYGDYAVSFVQCCFNKEYEIFDIFARVTPETTPRGEHYVVEVQASHNNVLFARCYSCPAQSDGCKHRNAMLMWLHRRSEDKSVTEEGAYWRRSRMASLVDLDKPARILFAAASEKKKGRSTSNVALPTDDSFLTEVLQELQSPAHKSILSTQFSEKFHVLSMHRLACKFCETILDKSYGSFKEFVQSEFLASNVEVLEEATRAQSKCPLWFEIKYGRVTASNFSAAASAGRSIERGGLTTEDRHYCELKVFGASKFRPTEAMKAGLDNEGKVLEVVTEALKIKVDPAGIFLRQDNPFFGASPDALTKDTCIEIKSPSSDKNICKYLKKDWKEPTKKVLMQMLVQMHFSGREKGLLIVAKPSFKDSRLLSDLIMCEISMDTYRETLLEHIRLAEVFYCEHIFPRLFATVSKLSK